MQHPKLIAALAGIAGVVSALAHPALAQTATIGENYVAAHAIFGQTAPAEVTAGLDGAWLPLSTLAGGPGAPAVGADSIQNYVEEFCGRTLAIVARVEQLGGTGFVMTVGPEDRPVAFRFDWLGGSRYARSFDPAAFLAHLGLDRAEDQAAQERQANALAHTPREVDIHRTAPDILVIHSAGQAEIYGRCPD
ncbi:MAG: hypothetical protein ACFCVH_07125 [Alphaproteobacteria bacterium]